MIKILENIQSISGSKLRLYRKDCLDLFLSHEKALTGKNRNKIIQDIREKGPRFAEETLRHLRPENIMSMTYQQVDKPSKYDIVMTKDFTSKFPNFAIILNDNHMFGYASNGIATYLQRTNLVNETYWNIKIL